MLRSDCHFTVLRLRKWTNLTSGFNPEVRLVLGVCWQRDLPALQSKSINFSLISPVEDYPIKDHPKAVA